MARMPSPRSTCPSPSASCLTSSAKDRSIEPSCTTTLGGGARGALHDDRRRPHLLRVPRQRRSVVPGLRHRGQRGHVAAQHPRPGRPVPARALGAPPPRPVGEPGPSHSGHLPPPGAPPPPPPPAPPGDPRRGG